MPIIAPKSPADCFDAAIEAARIALKYRTPVLVLSDGYLANGAEPWLLPDVADLPDISVSFTTEANGTDGDGNPIYLPYLRNEDMARPWAVPGTPGLEHRIGGLEKQDGTGNVSYDPANHEHMVHLRAERIEHIAEDIPLLEVDGPADADLLVVGWGSTWGAIDGAVHRARAKGHKVAMTHLTHLHPFPRNLGEVVKAYPKVLVPEMNLGQLSLLLRGNFLVDAQSVTKMKGLPFTSGEIERAILAELEKD